MNWHYYTFMIDLKYLVKKINDYIDVIKVYYSNEVEVVYKE